MTLPLQKICRKKRLDTVGELESAENYAAHMATLETQELGEAYAETSALSR
jgi:hypothetical protein